MNGEETRKKSTSARWLLVMTGVATSTLLVWQALNTHRWHQVEQTSQTNAAKVQSLNKVSQNASTSLVFAGSGSNLPIVKLLVKEFSKSRPDIKIKVPASIGSTGGIKAAADGAVAIGLIARPLKAEEQKLGLTVVPYARTAVVIGTHLSVVDDNITSPELIQIYQGRKAQWQDQQEIIVLTREPGDSSIIVLEQKIPKFKQVYAESQQAKRWSTLYTDQQMNQALATTPQAIGFSELGAITADRLPIKVLKLNGSYPTPKNVLSGSYPLVKSLSFVFVKEKLPAAAQDFLNFVNSQAGQKSLRTNGYLPGK